MLLRLTLQKEVLLNLAPHYSPAFGLLWKNLYVYVCYRVETHLWRERQCHATVVTLFHWHQPLFRNSDVIWCPCYHYWNPSMLTWSCLMWVAQIDSNTLQQHKDTSQNYFPFCNYTSQNHFSFCNYVVCIHFGMWRVFCPIVTNTI